MSVSVKMHVCFACDLVHVQIYSNLFVFDIAHYMQACLITALISLAQVVHCTYLWPNIPFVLSLQVLLTVIVKYIKCPMTCSLV